jgi:hypothetical protein
MLRTLERLFDQYTFSHALGDSHMHALTCTLIHSLLIFVFPSCSGNHESRQIMQVYVPRRVSTDTHIHTHTNTQLTKFSFLSLMIFCAVATTSRVRLRRCTASTTSVCAYTATSTCGRRSLSCLTVRDTSRSDATVFCVCFHSDENICVRHNMMCFVCLPIPRSSKPRCAHVALCFICNVPYKANTQPYKTIGNTTIQICR